MMICAPLLSPEILSGPRKAECLTLMICDEALPAKWLRISVG